MRLAFFTPVSPQKTGIADYSERELLPYLSKYCDIDVYIDQGIKPTNPGLINNFEWFSYDQYKKNAHNYDIPLYQMGNNEYHGFIYDSLLKYPGITVLHDIYLHGLLYTQSLVKGNSKRYISEFEYCYGDTGVKIAQNAIQSGVYPEFTHPLIKRIIDKSAGVICHSEFGIKQVFTEQPDSICTVIPQPFTPESELCTNNRLKKDYILKIPGIGNKFPIIISFGFVSAHKRYDVILKVFKKFLKSHPDAFFIVIGQDNIGLSRKIHELGLEKQVIITGFVSDDNVIELLKIADFCVNLRYPTAGETSRSVLQIMSLGKPVIVSNVGWFSELPDNTCLKVDADSYQNTVLLNFFILLSDNRVLNTKIGKNAREYIIKNHSPEKVAKQYYQFIRGILNGDEMIENRISRSFIDLGLSNYEDMLIKYQMRKIKDVL
jgi:glycosyltransferase involved in cell wall biosynthesis